MTKDRPFRLSIITDEVSQDPAIAIELARRFAYDGVELRSVWDSPVELLPEDRQAELSAMLGEAGLSVSAIASSFLKEDWGRDEREKFERLADTCRRFGCTVLRGFSFWRCESYSDEAFADCLRLYDELLGRQGLTLVLENDPAVNLSHAAELFRFFQKHSFENIGVLWDPGNDIYTLGSAALSAPAGFELLRPWIAHVHLKDAVTREGGAAGVAIGQGELDTVGLLRCLAGSGYRGYVALEPHFRLDGALDEAQLRRPGGSAFSEKGYLPSLMCMERLQDIMDRL